MQILEAFTREMLAFHWPRNAASPPPDFPGDRLDRAVRRALDAAGRPGRNGLVLLGIGNGQLAERLAASASSPFVVAEPDPERARAVLHSGRLGWLSDHAQLITDGSLWSLALLLHGSGLHAQQTAVIINPEESCPASRDRLKHLQRLLSLPEGDDLLPGCTVCGGGHCPPARDNTPARPSPPASVSLACILAPTEPALDDFFSQIPDWIHETVAVWDAADASAVPEGIMRERTPSGVPVHHIFRPLSLDFAAQRNAALSVCSGNWILMLDADERLTPEDWKRLPLLCETQAQGIWFPRRTFFPDAQHCRIGFGLWPDLQLRLFRKTPSLRFERPVHEVLSGLGTPALLYPDISLYHLSHLQKDRQTLQKKLDLFTQAGSSRSEGPQHRLNDEYPHIPASLLNQLAFRPRGLILHNVTAD